MLPIPPPLFPRLRPSHEPKLLSHFQLIIQNLLKMSTLKFTSMFKNFTLRSMDRKFVEQSLKFQIDVAKAIRKVDNRPRLIYSSTFVPVKTVFIECTPVLEDSQGVQAYFNDAAQLTLSPEYYYDLINKDIEIVMQHNNVVLLPLPSFKHSERNLVSTI
uniref:Uncharacterized protein n=1 Tax=Gonipterus platensis Macula-Like virus TaxID=2849064 RepID=A0A8F2Z0W6_9VIRU|nr:hypothetical protein [Gonipterus platensis Macula-Like virus]